MLPSILIPLSVHRTEPETKRSRLWSPESRLDSSLRTPDSGDRRLVRLETRTGEDKKDEMEQTHTPSSTAPVQIQKIKYLQQSTYSTYTTILRTSNVPMHFPTSFDRSSLKTQKKGKPHLSFPSVSRHVPHLAPLARAGVWGPASRGRAVCLLVFKYTALEYKYIGTTKCLNAPRRWSYVRCAPHRTPARQVAVDWLDSRIIKPNIK